MDNSDFSETKIGDKVWSPDFGEGEVIKKTLYKYPVVVDFKGHRVAYTIEGKRSISAPAPTLFHEKPDCFKTKVEKTVELKGYYDTVKGTFIPSQADPIPDKRYLSAKATITYEVME